MKQQAPSWYNLIYIALYKYNLYNKTIFNQIYVQNNIYPREYSKLKSYKINVLLI